MKLLTPFSVGVSLLILMCGFASAGEPAAVEKLAKTPLFAFGGIGFAGTTSDGEIAFHKVFASESAEGDFLHLLKSGNSQANCYALVGLRLKNRAVYQEQVTAFISSKRVVQTCAGCVMAKLPMSSVVAGIQRGDYDDQASAKLRTR